MRKANVRVEAKDTSYNPSRDEIDRNFKNLMAAFRQQCNKAGILKEIKKREFYETPSRIRRKKAREKETMLLKLKMKENFIQAPVKAKAKEKNKKYGR
jgi:small subunit ribosomal protein S21